MAGGSDLVFANVRLEHHAGVSAALAEGIPLADVLQQEGIAEADWKVADKKWREALSSSPDLQMEYARKRMEAEDALARKIDPVEDDAAAWVGLLGAVQAADDPSEVLKPLGLKSTDLGRLGRAWQRKAKKDPAVVKKLSELSGKGVAPTSVKAEPIKLKPFPWTKGAAAQSNAATPAASSSGGVSAKRSRIATPTNGVFPVEDDIDLYAAFSVASQLLPGETTRIVGLCGIDERRVPQIVAAWRQRLDADPNLRADFAVKSGEHRAAFRKMLGGSPFVVDE
jgi:hypothetical protein